jgi:nucleotide-binding universal stress UspA family protein
MSAFSKILIAVDGSQSSMNAASNAIAIAKKEHNSNTPQLLIALYVVFSRMGYHTHLQEYLAVAVW